MKKWNFHPMIIQGIEFRSLHEQDKKTPSTEIYLQATLQIAHVLVKALTLGRSCDQFVPTITNEQLIYLGLNTGITNQMVEKIFFKVKELCNFLNLFPKGVSTETIDHYCSRTIEPEICFFSVGREIFSPHFTYVKTLPYNTLPLFNFKQIDLYESTVKLLILSLDDLTPESAEAFLESDEFSQQKIPHTLIISSHTTALKKHTHSENVVLIPREIDLGLIGKILAMIVKPGN